MKKKTIAIAVTSITLILLLSVCLLSKCNVSNNEKGISFNPDTPQAWNEDTDNQKSDGIKIPGFSTVYFEAGTKQIQLTLANPKANTCYFTYELYLDNPDGELIYSSCRIDPGMAITDITLARALEQGEYTLYIKVIPCDIESNATLNSALLKASLIVNN